MKDYVIDVLMNIGVPAGIKGFTYICDAIELFNTDPYYPDGKISALYIDIAKKYHTTPSRVGVPYDTLSILHLQKVILIWYPAIWI